MIEARGLSKFYGPFVAIKDISFAIPKGQIVAFLGPNGAGKTTTMKILTGYLSPAKDRPPSPAWISAPNDWRQPGVWAIFRKTVHSMTR